MNRGQQHLPLDVLPVSALRRRDEFLHPVTGERLRLAAIFPEGESTLLACAGEDGTLRRVRLHPRDVVRTPREEGGEARRA